MKIHLTVQLKETALHSYSDSNEVDLEKHVQTGNMDAKGFSCSLCRKSFSQSSALKNHMRISHTLFEMQMADQVKPARVILRDLIRDSNISGQTTVDLSAECVLLSETVFHCFWTTFLLLNEKVLKVIFFLLEIYPKIRYLASLN